MSICPECSSRNVKEDVYPEYWNDGQGYEWWEAHYYWCEDCGCEWTETKRIERTVEIVKHGKL
jgi:hypothetical protein